MSKKENKYQELLDKIELLATNKKLKASVYLQKTKDVAVFLSTNICLSEDEAWRTAHGLVLREIVTGNRVTYFEGLVGDMWDKMNPKTNKRTCGFEIIDCNSMTTKYPVYYEGKEFEELTFGPCSTFFIAGLLIKKTKGEGDYLEILFQKPTCLTPRRVEIKPVRANIEEVTSKEVDEQW